MSVTATEPSPPNLGLGEILRVLHRRWRNVAVITVVVTALVLIFTFAQSDKYKATAVLLVRTVDSDAALQADPNAQAPYYAARQQQDDAYTLNSSAQRAAVAKVYHGHANVDDVKATALMDGSDAINISATGSNAKDVANLANLYAKTYITDTNKSRDAVLNSGEAAIKQQLVNLNTEQAQAGAPLAALQNQQAANPGDPRLAEQIQTVRDQIAPQLSAIASQIQSFETRLQNLRVSSSVSGAETATLTAAATPPSSPSSPNPLRNGIIGLVLGLGLGIAYALAKEFMRPAGARIGPEPRSDADASRAHREGEEREWPGHPTSRHEPVAANGQHGAEALTSDGNDYDYDLPGRGSAHQGLTAPRNLGEHFASDD